MTRIAIVGARSHRALPQVWRRVRELPGDTTVVSGGADGVDAVATISARQRGLPVEEHLPDYTTHGERAPLVRNTAIATTVAALEAFPWEGCRGTWDAVAKARAAGVPVTIHEPDVEHPALLVFTARRSYAGHRALVSMRHGGDPAGEPFAPSAALLGAALAERERAAKLRLEATALRGAQLTLGEPVEDTAARELRAAELENQAGAIEEASWLDYRPRFLAEMRVSCGLARGTSAWARRPPAERELHEEAWTRGVRPRPQAWARLLEAPFVVITCKCTDPTRCHRAILRETILPALGAVDGGEVPCR